MSEQPLTETAEIGDLVHDLGEDHEVGWFIVGEGGHWDVDNACWTEATEDDAPWTSEHFEIFGPVPALVIPPGRHPADHTPRAEQGGES